MVIWLIGMSASGKTTIGKKLFKKLQNSKEKWIFLDGDTFRNILGEDLGHTIEDRRKNAYRISRFCEFLSSKNINVLACVLSIFHDNQKYNKENIKEYKEVYIDVEFDKLVQRDNKQLYKKALNGEIKDVVGVDIEFKPPYSPDMIIDNNIDNSDYEKICNNMINNFNINIDNSYTYTNKNLLKYPHKYQYSKFEGQEFFNKIKNDRDSSIEFLTKRLEKLKSSDDNIQELRKESYLKDDNLYLREFLIYLYLSDIEELKKQKNIIELLIKRFEVGKKLYKTYDTKEIRKSSTEFEDMLNYPLFSLILQKYYKSDDTQQKLVYLNAILKVNDIISSVRSEFIIYDEIFYSIEALKNELIIMGEYL